MLDFAALADVDANVLGTNVENTEKSQGKKPDAYKDYGAGSRLGSVPLPT